MKGLKGTRIEIPSTDEDIAPLDMEMTKGLRLST